MDEYNIIGNLNKKVGITDQTLTITRNGKEIALNRVVALEDIKNSQGIVIAKKGTLGGYYNYQDRKFRPQEGWIGDEAKVYDEANFSGDSIVCGNAELFGNANLYRSCIISGNAKVFGKATVSGRAEVTEDAKVFDNARIDDDGKISGKAQVYGSAIVYNKALVHGNSEVFGQAKICESAEITDNAKVYDAAEVCGNVKIYEDANVCGGKELFAGDRVILNKGACISGNAQIFGNAKIDGDAKIDGFAKVDFNVGIGQVVSTKQGEKSIIEANGYQKEYQKRKEVLLRDIRDELVNELEPKIRTKVEAEITAKVEAEIREKVEAELREKIETELREKIEAELREELKNESAPQQEEQANEEDENGYKILKTLNGWGITDITQEFDDANADTYTLNQIVALKDIVLSKTCDASKKLVQKYLKSDMAELIDQGSKSKIDRIADALDDEEFNTTIKEGTLGGFVELDAIGDWQDDGETWIDEEVAVFGMPNIQRSYLIGETTVCDNVQIEDSLVDDSAIYENAVVKKSILSNAEAYGVAKVTSSAIAGGEVYGAANIKNSALLENVEVYGSAKVENSFIINDAEVYGSAKVAKSIVGDNAEVYGKAELNGCLVYDKATVYGNAKVNKGAEVCGNAVVCGQAVVDGSVDEGIVVGVVAKQEETEENQVEQHELVENTSEAQTENKDSGQSWYIKNREKGLDAIENVGINLEEVEKLKFSNQKRLVELYKGHSILDDSEKEILADYVDVMHYNKIFDQVMKKVGNLLDGQLPTVRNMKSYAVRVEKFAKDIDKCFNDMGISEVPIEAVEELLTAFKFIALTSSEGVLEDVYPREKQGELAADIYSDVIDYVAKVEMGEEIVDEVDVALDNLNK